MYVATFASATVMYAAFAPATVMVQLPLLICLHFHLRFSLRVTDPQQETQYCRNTYANQKEGQRANAEGKVVVHQVALNLSTLFLLVVVKKASCIK